MKFLVIPVIFAAVLQLSEAGPLRIQKRAAFYIANETACVVDNTVYFNGDPIPTDDPCEACKCRPPGFACVLKECESKPGCRAVRRAGHCCPEYICGCEHNGRMYRDGDEIYDSQNPCYTCHCQGSSIACAFVDCFFRVDCAPEYVPGECCPHYNHCLLLDTDNSSSTEAIFSEEKDSIYVEIATDSPSLESTQQSVDLSENTGTDIPQENALELKIEDNVESIDLQDKKTEISEENIPFSAVESKNNEHSSYEITEDNAEITDSVPNLEAEKIPNLAVEPELDEKNEDKQLDSVAELLNTDSEEAQNEKIEEKPEDVSDESSEESNNAPNTSPVFDEAKQNANAELFPTAESDLKDEKLPTDQVAETTTPTDIPVITSIPDISDELDDESNDIKKYRSLENGGKGNDTKDESTEIKEEHEPTEKTIADITSVESVSENYSKQSVSEEVLEESLPEKKASVESLPEKKASVESLLEESFEERSTISSKIESSSQGLDIKEETTTSDEDRVKTDVITSPENLLFKSDKIEFVGKVTAVVHVHEDTDSGSEASEVSSSPSTNTTEDNLYKAIHQVFHSHETTKSPKEATTSQVNETPDPSSQKTSVESTAGSVLLTSDEPKDDFKTITEGHILSTTNTPEIEADGSSATKAVNHETN